MNRAPREIRPSPQPQPQPRPAPAPPPPAPEAGSYLTTVVLYCRGWTERLSLPQPGQRRLTPPPPPCPPLRPHYPTPRTRTHSLPSPASPPPPPPPGNEARDLAPASRPMTTPKPPNRFASGASLPAAPRVLVGITGGSGAGKSWLAHHLSQRLHPHAGIIALDDFYRDLAALPPSRRDRVNFDTPDAIDWELFDACLDRIRAGRPVAIPYYDFTLHARRDPPRRWDPKRIILVEGLWLWSRRAQQRHYSLRLFVDTPEDLRLRRRLARDTAQRARTPASVRRQWREHVNPMHAIHVAPQAASSDATIGANPSAQDLDHLELLIRDLAGLPHPTAHDPHPQPTP